ncbi:uncharacterized protein LOC109719115 [Ananas comosus]|uniref:Uncharacterized protein LOC109719115 n=1 Tax=Ananas comosus TaxID=4615 RepID=A0A6P5G079_ANACO|nr:uncharacterized protein LOC109719115 [Ananas comosus]
MAYRRKQGITRSATFVEDRRSFSGADDSSAAVAAPASPSLAAQAIRSSAARRDASLSSAYADSALAAAPARPRHSQDASNYEYTSMKSLNERKHGFWGDLARKAKSIIEDGASNKSDDYGRVQPPKLDSSTGTKSRWAAENYLKPENPSFQKGSEAIASSVNYIGGKLRNALEESRTIIENKTVDIIHETKKLQIRRKDSSSNLQNQFKDVLGPANLSQSETNQETQLKASRNVANAMAAKAKLLLRELKAVKADLAFAKERCAQLEEENKILRESREKGDHNEDDDLIRLQLESLLAEKARLAHENSIYARENRFLREIVEFHQLTSMGDGVDLDDGIEEDAADVYADEMLPLSQSHSQNEVPSPALSSPRSPSAALVGSSSPKSPHEHLSQTLSMETGSPAPQ